jgi:transposase
MFKEDKTQIRPPILDELPQDQAGAIESLLQAKESKITALEKENHWLKEQFKLHQQRLYGRSTETSQALQTMLIFDEMPTTLPEEPTLEIITFQREKTKKLGRKIDFSLFPTEQKIHDLKEDEKICACGAELVKIGEDGARQLEHISEQYKVIEHIRCKYTCRKCETIKMASKEEAPIPKCLAGSSLLTDIIIKKFEHHLPLYRQAKILQTRNIHIPDNTLCNWVMKSAEVLLPLGECLWEELNQVHLLQSDDTKVKILELNKEGFMWGYHSLENDNRFILFEFNKSRGSHVVNHRLQHFQGILQTDGLSSYNCASSKRRCGEYRLLGSLSAKVQ